MEKLLSIIVPIYNAEKYLTRCIESLINQRYKNIEILLINDGSLDKSKDICKMYAKKDERIILIDKSNQGVSSARNEGLKIAKGDYIAFCDADDWVEEDIYLELIDNIKKYDCEIACCDYFTSETDVNVNDIEKFEKVTLDDALYLVLAEKKVSGFLWNKVFKRDIIYNNKPIEFNTQIHILEDQLFIVKCMNNCKNMLILNTKLYHYGTNEGSALNSRMTVKSITEVNAREEIYNEIKKITSNEKIIYIAWSQLVKSCSLMYKKVIFNNIVDERIKHIKILKCIMKKHKLRYKLREDFSFKEKIYYYLCI